MKVQKILFEFPWQFCQTSIFHPESRLSREYFRQFNFRSKSNKLNKKLIGNTEIFPGFFTGVAVLHNLFWIFASSRLLEKVSPDMKITKFMSILLYLVFPLISNLTLSWRGPANQWTGFYMITASVMKEIITNCCFGSYLNRTLTKR